MAQTADAAASQTRFVAELASRPPARTTSVHTIYMPVVAGQQDSGGNGGAQIYWGALVGGQAPSPGNLNAGGVFPKFEENAGKGMSILHWGQPWELQGAMMPFQASYFTATRNRGSIPMLDWGAWALGGGPNQPKYRLSAITAGTHDGYIRQWATDAKTWGHPFFLRFNWEMNGNWQFPWSEQLNGNRPGDYVRAWRHVHDIFGEIGADNVTWVWCPNVSGGTTLPYSTLYPGDDYVDWTCLDGYNFYDAWLTSRGVFQGVGIAWLYDSYQELLSVAPAKPIMIGETSSLEAGDGGEKKAAWITELLLDALPNAMPQVKALVWFNWHAHNPAHATLPIESSPASISAFAAGIGTSYYAPNRFGNINTSPIPPP